MFLESMLSNKKLDKATLDLIKLIISQLTLSFCLVNDIHDMKIIKLD